MWDVIFCSSVCAYSTGEYILVTTQTLVVVNGIEAFKNLDLINATESKNPQFCHDSTMKMRENICIYLTFLFLHKS